MGFIGADDTGPVELLPPHASGHKLLTCRYASGVLILHSPGYRLPGVTFVGAEGTVNTSRWYCRSEPPSVARQAIGPGDVHLYVSDNHHDNFLRCIRTRQRPVADIAPIACSITLCHLGNIAYWLRRPLRWDPARERFAADPLADRWLDRPRRGPWRL